MAVYASKMLENNKFMNRILTRNVGRGIAASEIMASAIKAVDPYQCIFDHVRVESGVLKFGKHQVDLAAFERVFLIGFGKASVPMAKGLLDLLGEKIGYAKVITKDRSFLPNDGDLQNLQVLLGGHPVPSKESIESTRLLLKDVSQLSSKDLVLVVISGGGSALFTSPLAEITLEDMQQLTTALLHSGANITEINTLRKHLDQVKGGGLAAWLHPASICTFVLSDVIGDSLDMIASGPTVSDPTTFQDAMNVISKYDLFDKVPVSILQCLEEGVNGKIPETLKPGSLPDEHLRSHLVGTNIQSAMAAKETAESLGYNALIITSHLTGRTDRAAEFIAAILQTLSVYDHPISKPACLILGGETTVEVVGNGLGGRNQDLALHMVKKIAGLKDVLFIALATDGEDGPTDAAGAVCDGLVFEGALNEMGLKIETFIENNDAYHYFERVGGLIKTGSTGTNVNDLIIVLVD